MGSYYLGQTCSPGSEGAEKPAAQEAGRQLNLLGLRRIWMDFHRHSAISLPS